MDFLVKKEHSFYNLSREEIHNSLTTVYLICQSSKHSATKISQEKINGTSIYVSHDESFPYVVVIWGTSDSC